MMKNNKVAEGERARRSPMPSIELKSNSIKLVALMSTRSTSSRIEKHVMADNEMRTTG